MSEDKHFEMYPDHNRARGIARLFVTEANGEQYNLFLTDNDVMRLRKALFQVQTVYDRGEKTWPPE